jgi:hypothetical protein
MPDFCSDAVGIQMRHEAERHAIHAGRTRVGELGNVRDAERVSAALPFARWRFIHRVQISLRLAGLAVVRGHGRPRRGSFMVPLLWVAGSDSRRLRIDSLGQMTSRNRCGF